MPIGSTIAPIAALLFSVALLLTGNGLQGTLLPVRAELEAFGTFNIGILGSSYFLGFGLGCVFAAQLVRSVGHIRTFTALTAIASASALAHAIVVDPIAWWPLRAVTGFCFAGLYVVIESWLNESATNQTRGRIMSIYTVINLTVVTVGQLMVTLYDPAAFPLFALVSILISMAAVPVAMTSAQAPPPPQVTLLRPRRMYRISPVGLLGSFSSGLALGPFWALAPVFAIGIGLEITGVAIFMSITVIAGAIGQWPLGWLSDRIDRRKVIVAACGIAALAGVLLAIMGAFYPSAVLIAAFFFGMFAIPVYAISVAHTNDFVDPGAFVEASSTLLLAFAAGAVAGPLIAAAVMGPLGAPGLFVMTAVVHALLALFAIHRMRQRNTPSPQDRAPFVAVPRTSPAMAVLDPRADQELAAQAAQAETARKAAERDVPGGLNPAPARDEIQDAEFEPSETRRPRDDKRDK